MGVALFTLWTWLLPTVVIAGAIRSEEPIESPCGYYTKNELLYLDCSDRGLTELPDDLNYNAQALLLANNNFASFPEQLENFSQVEILDLSGNRLSRPLPDYFKNWNDLHTLNLSKNNYDTWLTPDYQSTIKRLDLSTNKIGNIEVKAFTNMPNLSFLDLSENRLYDLPPNVFADAHNLDTLYLARNYFSTVPNFQSQSLRTLWLGYCQISSIDSMSLSGMSSLIAIDLCMNQLEYIPDELSSNTLQELDLSYNVISTINDRTFAALPHLAVLDMRGNEFREVWSTSHFASNPFLRVVHVKGNRWSCEGFSVNLFLTYQFLTKEPPKTADLASLTCYSPSNVTQMSWEQAYILTWHPNEMTAQSYTMMAVFIGIIIGILITSCVCRCLISFNRSDHPPTISETTVLNVNGSAVQPRLENHVVRVALTEDLPPTYDEALLMPRLNSSFHSLPDFVDEHENSERNYRRSRSIGDLTETRPRSGDRRSLRRTVEINITST